jgi:hypothetical protein
MNDRLARTLAAVSIGLAAIAVVVSMYALSILQETEHELRALSDGVTRALAAQRSSDVPLRGPPPALDPGDD